MRAVSFEKGFRRRKRRSFGRRGCLLLEVGVAGHHPLVAAEYIGDLLLLGSIGGLALPTGGREFASFAFAAASHTGWGSGVVHA